MTALNKNRSYKKMSLLTALLFFLFSFAFGQPGLPPRTLTVTPTQAIHFGTFCVTEGSGGTVTVGWDGSRSSTGNVILLSMAPTSKPAIFEIKLCQGRNVSITFAPSITLTGSNGGTLTMDIGPTEKGGNNVSFPVNNDCNFITPLRVGGTLHIPGTVLTGIYTGSFEITLNQE